MGYKGPRSYLTNKYHYCSRCGTRYPLSKLQWQRGLLLCVGTKENCFDTGNAGLPLPGDREMAITRALEGDYNTGNQELMPDPKLVESDIIQASMDEDLIY